MEGKIKHLSADNQTNTTQQITKTYHLLRKKNLYLDDLFYTKCQKPD